MAHFLNKRNVKWIMALGFLHFWRINSSDNVSRRSYGVLHAKTDGVSNTPSKMLAAGALKLIWKSFSWTDS